MIIISKSLGTCGCCGAGLEVEWDLDLIDYYEVDGECATSTKVM